MLYSLALLFLSALIFGGICSKLKLPPLIGMLISGILLGPSVLDLLDGSLLDISAQLRKIALIIILTRAGLGLDINALKKVGRPALLMCFLPATAEIAGTLLLAPRLMQRISVRSMSKTPIRLLPSYHVSDIGVSAAANLAFSGFLEREI